MKRQRDDPSTEEAARNKEADRNEVAQHASVRFSARRVALTSLMALNPALRVGRHWGDGGTYCACPHCVPATESQYDRTWSSPAWMFARWEDVPLAYGPCRDVRMHSEGPAAVLRGVKMSHSPDATVLLLLVNRTAVKRDPALMWHVLGKQQHATPGCSRIDMAALKETGYPLSCHAHDAPYVPNLCQCVLRPLFDHSELRKRLGVVLTMVVLAWL